MKTKKNMITFYGADSQVGTTMVALSTAEMLARQRYMVLFLCADGGLGNPFVQRGLSTSMDDLRSGFRDKTVTAEEIRQNVVIHRGVDILSGVQNWHSSRYYEREDLLQVACLVGRDYDYVIADGGSGLDGLSLAAICACDLACVVLTQQEKSLERMRSRLPLVQENMPKRRCYVVNKFQPSRAFYSMNELKRLVGCEREDLLRIDYVPYGWQAEKDHQTLLNIRGFRRGIKSLTTYLEGRDKDAGEGL